MLLYFVRSVVVFVANEWKMKLSSDVAIWRHVKKKVFFHDAQRFFIVLLNEYFFSRWYLKYSFYILFSIEMRRVSAVGPTALFFGALAILSAFAIPGADGFNRESSSRSGFRNKTEASREGKLCEYVFIKLGKVSDV